MDGVEITQRGPASLRQRQRTQAYTVLLSCSRRYGSKSILHSQLGSDNAMKSLFIFQKIPFCGLLVLSGSMQAPVSLPPCVTRHLVKSTPEGVLLISVSSERS